MDLYNQIAQKIIEAQEQIIGPVAIQQAERVPLLVVDWQDHKVSINGNGAQVIDELVEQYKELFGQIAVQTCRESASRYLAQLPPDKLPKSLQ